MEILNKLKEHQSSRNVSVDKYLMKKYPNGQWFISEKNELIYNIVISGMNVQYKWKVTGEEIEAVSGRAVELTPDLHNETRHIE